jgi:hypothetical protein
MNIQMIPLNRLIPSPANVRKTGTCLGVEELAASIAAHGLLQNLQVRPAKGGKFEVAAGGRRLPCPASPLAVNASVLRPARLSNSGRADNGQPVRCAPTPAPQPMCRTGPAAHPADNTGASFGRVQSGAG